MFKGICKLFSFNGSIGRWEYFKIVWGLAFLPILSMLWAVSVRPEEHTVFLVSAGVAFVVALLYLWICLACMFKRLYNIFANRYVIIFLFFLIYFGIQFVFCPIAKVYFSYETMLVIRKLSTCLLCMFLIFMPGRYESDKLMPGWVFFFPFLLSVSLLFATKYYNITSFVSEKGMTPALKPYDRLYINIFDKDFNRGDIVVFNSVYKQNYINRIVGLPGDEIKVEGNDVFINGEKFDEEYVNTETPSFDCPEDFSCGPLIVPEDNYYVLGDNRGNSHDSRFFGVVNKDEIFGKASHIFYPRRRRHSL